MAKARKTTGWEGTISVTLSSVAEYEQFGRDMNALNISVSQFGRLVLPKMARLAVTNPAAFDKLFPEIERKMTLTIAKEA